MDNIIIKDNLIICCNLNTYSKILKDHENARKNFLRREHA